jgi:predicted DNA-binding transcriptional regulator AlpA
MTVWRWLRDPYLGFPQPIYLGKRRYWRLADLEAWERSRAAASQGEAA